MKLKKAFVGGAVVVIIALSIVTMISLINTKPESKRSPNRTNVLGVKTLTTALDDYSISVTYPGRVASRDITTLSSEVSGRLLATKTPLKVGQRFRKGDVLIEIFNEDVKAQHAALTSSFLTTLASSLPDIKIDIPSEYDKWYNFFKAIDVDKTLPALPTISSDKEKVYLSAKGILSAYYTLLTSEINLEKYQIAAPFNGAYTSVSKEVGAITSLGGEIARMASTDALELVVGVPTTLAQTLAAGTEIDIISDTKSSYKGRINRISPFVDATTQRVNLYILFTEPSMDIIEGQLLSITMPSNDITEVQEVLREAVIGDTIVYTVVDNKLYTKAVSIVTTTPQYAYITGVSNGDVIVGESLVSPYEEMPVKILDMNGNSVE